MQRIETHIEIGGRIVIPAEYRKQLGMNVGDRVVLTLEDGEMRLITPGRAIEGAQAIVRRHVPMGHSVSEELISERREEAARGSSALLTLLNAESGARLVATVLPGGTVSSVNFSEVASKLAEAGLSAEAIGDALEALPIDIVSFNAEQAYEAGLLRPSTRGFGLSLGDRAYLSLARRLRAARAHRRPGLGAARDRRRGAGDPLRPQD